MQKLYFKTGTFVIDTSNRDVQWAAEKRPHESAIEHAKIKKTPKTSVNDKHGEKENVHMVKLKKNTYTIPDFDTKFNQEKQVNGR